MKIYAKSGWLTRYGLACDSIQQFNTTRYTAKGTFEERISLHAEHGVLHVRWYTDGMRTAWETFDKLKDAQSTMRRFIREVSSRAAI